MSKIIENTKTSFSDDELFSFLQWDGIRLSDEEMQKARHGEGEILYYIANEYYHKKKNYKALEWYLKSAAQNYSDAQYRIGYLYHFGEGVPIDYKQAMDWYRKATDNGNKVAKAALKRLNEKAYYAKNKEKEEKEKQEMAEIMESNKSEEGISHREIINTNEQNQPTSTSQTEKNKIKSMEEEIKKLKEAVQHNKNQKDHSQQILETLKREKDEMQAQQKEKNEENKRLRESLRQYKAALDDNSYNDIYYDSSVEESDHDKDVNYDTEQDGSDNDDEDNSNGDNRQNDINYDSPTENEDRKLKRT